MIKVAHIVTTMNIGGIETLIMNIIRNNTNKNIVFEVIVFDEEIGHYEAELKRLGVKVHHLVSIRNGYRKSIKQLNKFILQNKYKAVHLHCSALAYVFTLSYCKRIGIEKRIIHSHNSTSPNSKLYKLLKLYLKINLKRICTNMLACSTDAGINLFGSSNIDDVVLVNNGVNLDKYSFNNNVRDEIRNNLKLNDKIIIGHVGRFEEQKNHSFLIDIFNEIVKNDKAKYHLLLIGTGYLYDETIKKINDMNLTDNITIIEKSNIVEKYMMAMDAFIMPSLHEGLPLVLIEAQAISLPIIISDTISNECNITGDIKFISLDTKSEEWASSILEYTTSYQRKDNKSKIINAGFDINHSIDLLNRIYEGE